MEAREAMKNGNNCNYESDEVYTTEPDSLEKNMENHPQESGPKGKPGTEMKVETEKKEDRKEPYGG